MILGLQVWPEVKQANPDRSVCELGKVIGRMWREMADIDKQPYFESFTNAKVDWQILYVKLNICQQMTVSRHGNGNTNSQ